LKTTNRTPISVTNSVLVSILIIGAVVATLTQNWFGAILLLASGIFILGSALYARRPNSRDITRLNALEYRDERDRTLAKEGFAAIGAAALIVTVVEVVLAVILFNQFIELACAQLLVLAIVWNIANSNAVKRS